MRHLLAGVAGLAIAVLAALAVAGSSRLDGPVLWELSRWHGVHQGDLAVAAVAVVALVTVVGLHRLGRRSRVPDRRADREAEAGQR